ncbi:MAG TPA: hypothetical protein VIS57_02995 [Xanthomonadales bacterium]
MQRVYFQHKGFTQIHSQACRVLPGHGTGIHDQAVNDDVYDDKNKLLWLVISVLGNVIGGTLLLSCLFLLPHIVARMLD